MESVRTVDEQELEMRYKGSLLRPGIVACIKATGHMGDEPKLGMTMVRTCLLS